VRRFHFVGDQAIGPRGAEPFLLTFPTFAASTNNIPERLLAALNNSTGGQPPGDDLTVVVLRR
jgi:hypothetical protein